MKVKLRLFENGSCSLDGIKCKVMEVHPYRFYGLNFTTWNIVTWWGKRIILHESFKTEDFVLCDFSLREYKKLIAESDERQKEIDSRPFYR